MAVRFDAATDRISYLGATDPPATFTITCWVYLSVDRDDYSTFIRVWNSALVTVGTWDFDGDGTSGPNWFTGGGSLSNSTGIVVGEWRKVAATRTGSSGQIMVATPAGSTEVDSGTVGINVPDGLTIGGRDTGDATEWLNGRVAQVRVWDSVLTQGQIEAEWASTTPVITSGLWADWPLTVHTDLNDASGNARHLTAGSTAVTTEADPPNGGITGALAASVPLPVAALAATVTDAGALAASVPLPTSALVATVTDTGALVASVPLPTSALAATVTDAGALSASAPLPEAALVATVTNAAALAASVPIPTAAITGGVESPPTSITGVLAASIPLPTAALTGTVPVLGVLVASVPLPVAALTGAVEGGVQYPLHAGGAVRLAQLVAGSATRLGAYRAGALERI